MSELIPVNDQPPERAFLVGVVKKGETRHQVADTLAELALLADTAGAIVVDKIVQERVAPDSATFIGKGLAESLAERVKAEKIELVLFDDDLSPAQAKNLELLWENVRVIDRTGLILDIFAKRAHTREAIVQVEVAQLEYLLPRLSGRWAHLERQRGGIGLRGPGETQLETDRRLIRERIAHLKRMLQFIETQRQTRGKHRETSFRIAIVGYTNAGKSTLLKALCGGEPFIENRLFATLDPLVRPLRLPNSTEPALLTDTVGFIRKLPHGLVASFHSTLMEAVEADFLLHVADATHPNVEQQMAEVTKVLEEIGADKVPQLLLLNKIDEVDDNHRLVELRKKFPESLFISALRGHRLWELKNTIAERRATDWSGSEVLLSPEGAGEGVAAIYRMGEVLSQEVKEDGTTKVKYRVPVRNQRTLEETLLPLQWRPEVKKRALPDKLKDFVAPEKGEFEMAQDGSDSRYPARSQRERPRHSRPPREENRSQQEIDLANEDPPRNRSGQIIQPERQEERPFSRYQREGSRDRVKPEREWNRERPPARRDDRDDRPPRRDFGDRPPPRRFDRDDRPAPRRDRDDRPPRRDFGDRPPPRRFDRDDRPAPRRDRDDRPPRRDFGDRPPPRRFDRDDRPAPRRDRDDRPPRRDFGDRPPPRRFDRDDRPAPRRDRDDRPPRRDFGDRPPPRRFDRDDRPAPRHDRDDRPPRRDFGDRPPPRRDRNDSERPPRREFGDRPPRRDFGDRPDRPRTPHSAEGSRPSRSRDDRPAGGSRYGSKPKSGGYGGGGSRNPRQR